MLNVLLTLKGRKLCFPLKKRFARFPSPVLSGAKLMLPWAPDLCLVTGDNCTAPVTAGFQLLPRPVLQYQ